MERYDLLVVGGGINGAGIARDAAGRRLKVLLVERDDLGAATSSASSKLIHGGLRYLEQFQFGLVAEALSEREVLLRTAPHLVRPVRFVMPHVPALRPAWMIRAGLIGYDYLARRHALEASRTVDLRASPYGAGFRTEFGKGFVYSDCAVDDARLVVATARAAADLGAVIRPRMACVAAQLSEGLWRATLRGTDGHEMAVAARAIVNAAGPWVREFLATVIGRQAGFGVKLVKGSHIVVPRLYEGEHSCILQNDDGRVVFACAYEGGYTLIGTTEVELRGAPGPCQATPEEVAYLCRAANRYFARPISPGDVVWSYCGVRPLFDDGSPNPSAISREYVLRVDAENGAPPVLSVVGGKITTFRRLAEKALAALAPWFPAMSAPWTRHAAFPGGDLRGEPFDQFADF
ncbi:MAG TPA: glycerol-3-phosphate dehydrogenase, partial [Burkholderiales bacterium]|nr:glycerol-3-phosphate dehydrogenase [Burkholderiales bacterium]